MGKRRLQNKIFCAALFLLCALGLLLFFVPLLRTFGESVTALLRSWGVLPGIGRVFLKTLGLLLLTVALVVPSAALITLWMFRSLRGAALMHVRRFLQGFSRLPAAFFGLAVYGLTLGSAASRDDTGMMAGLLFVMFLPYTVARFDLALRSVKPCFREAGDALSGSPSRVFLHVILPQAVPDLARAVLGLTEKVLGEATALLVLLGEVLPNQLLATELFRLSWLGRQDAAVLAMGLAVTAVLLRVFTALKWKGEREEEICRYNWW